MGVQSSHNWGDQEQKISASEKRKRRAAVTRLIREFKTGKLCAGCDKPFAHYLLEFDHIHGVKRFNISQSRHLPIAVVLAEMAKCQLLCALCHKTKNWVEAHTPFGRMHRRMRYAA